MVLPNNGRIVIVDDNINEAQPLINILSKKRIPFNYYSGTRATDFPDIPNENKFRVLFLDLNIFELNKDAKTVISSIDAILKAIIPDNPNPYLLIIWSKQSTEYQTALEQHFINHIPNKTPAKIIFLQKNNYFDYVDGKWIPQEGSIQRIEQDLTEHLNNISLLSNLINWENIVHKKTLETINEFSSFFPFDENWDKNSKAIMFHLAKSAVGDDYIGGLNDSEKLLKAFENMNSFLADKLENEIHNAALGNVTGIADENYNRENRTDGLTPKIKSQINEKLHISSKYFTINDFEQGNIYPIENYDSLIERIIWSKIFNPENAIRLGEIRAASRLVELDITPVCDYSQEKQYVRIVSGVLTTPQFAKYFKSQFYSLTPIINVSNAEKIFVFDFRFIRTTTKEEIRNRNIAPSIKLRKEICTDIQSQLSNQVNRPGISNV